MIFRSAAAVLVMAGVPAHAVTLAEFLNSTPEFQAIYSAGAIDAYILDQGPGPEQAECAIRLQVQSVYDEIAALLVKHPQLAGQNAAAVLLGVVHRRCGASK